MDTTAKSMIRLEDVTKVFHTDDIETHAFSGVHLEIKNGEFVSIAGTSGCGKSTLLSILGLLDSPTEGGYWIHTQPVANLSFSDRTRIRNREIGFIFQAFNLIGDLRVYENVELPLTYRGMASANPQKAGRRSTRAHGDGASHEALSFPAFRRPTAARGRGARPSGFAFDSAGGRADRKLGLEEQRSGGGFAPATAPRGRDHLHGHTRPALRERCGPHDSSF